MKICLAAYPISKSVWLDGAVLAVFKLLLLTKLLELELSFLAYWSAA